jgi:hypothetical protein
MVISTALTRTREIGIVSYVKLLVHPDGLRMVSLEPDTVPSE